MQTRHDFWEAQINFVGLYKQTANHSGILSKKKSQNKQQITCSEKHKQILVTLVRADWSIDLSITQSYSLIISVSNREQV